MLQIVFNTGDNYYSDAGTPWYESSLFAALFSSVFSLAVVYIADWVAQRTKKREREKLHSELSVYFFAQCDNLLSSVGEQLNQHSELKKQIENNPYGGYKLSLISSLNLDKIYALTPTQTFEIFVKESKEAAKKLSKKEIENVRKTKSDSIVKIYRAFDLIQTVKTIDIEVRTNFTTNNTLESTNYWETIFKLKLFKGQVLNDAFKRNKEYEELGKKLHEIVQEFDKVLDRKIPDAQEHLVQKMIDLFKSETKYIDSPYWEEFLAINADVTKYKSKCEALSKQLGMSVDGFIESLKRAQNILREEVGKLRAASEKKNNEQET